MRLNIFQQNILSLIINLDIFYRRYLTLIYNMHEKRNYFNIQKISILVPQNINKYIHCIFIFNRCQNRLQLVGNIV